MRSLVSTQWRYASVASSSAARQASASSIRTQSGALASPEAAPVAISCRRRMASSGITVVLVAPVQQRVDLERHVDDRQAVVRRLGPALARPVPIQLDAVAVR